MKFPKNIRVLGKTLPSAVLAIIVMAGAASATLLVFYGQIVANYSVQQSVRLDNMVCQDEFGAGCTITSTETATIVAGTTIDDSPHNVENFAPVAANVRIDSASTCSDVSPVVSTTLTETSSADDYSSAFNSRASMSVSGLDLTQVLSEPLQYTANIVSNPLYAPNINIYITDGVNNYVIQAWGKDWSSAGLQTVTFSDLVTGVNGYGATVNPGAGVWPAIIGTNSDSDGNYFTVEDLISDYGSWSVTNIEVRTQAGAAGGQVLRIVQFVANGTIMDIPDSDNLNGETFSLQPSESVTFGVTTEYPINLLASECSQTTQVVPSEIS